MLVELMYKSRASFMILTMKIVVNFSPLKTGHLQKYEILGETQVISSHFL